jgi:hypothetical protein
MQCGGIFRKCVEAVDDGVAIQMTAPLCEAHTITVDFIDLGGFEWQVLRPLNEDVVDFRRLSNIPQIWW